MKLIVGLGNPGEKYKNTRHNVGFMVLDDLAIKLQKSPSDFKSNQKLKSQILKIDNTILAKPQTFMNSSGSAVNTLCSFYKLIPDHLYVIHDDLDLELGQWKIQYTKKPKEHGGINDIEQKLSTGKFWRVRVGIDSRKPENRTNGEEYVLQVFSPEEMTTLEKVINEVVKELFKIVHE